MESCAVQCRRGEGVVVKIACIAGPPPYRRPPQCCPSPAESCNARPLAAAASSCACCLPLPAALPRDCFLTGLVQR